MNAKVTRSSTLRTPNNLTAGQLSNWLQNSNAPDDARIRVNTDIPPRGEFGVTTVRIEATWEEDA